MCSRKLEWKEMGFKVLMSPRYIWTTRNINRMHKTNYSEWMLYDLGKKVSCLTSTVLHFEFSKHTRRTYDLKLNTLLIFRNSLGSCSENVTWQRRSMKLWSSSPLAGTWMPQQWQALEIEHNCQTNAKYNIRQITNTIANTKYQTTNKCQTDDCYLLNTTSSNFFYSYCCWTSEYYKCPKHLHWTPRWISLCFHSRKQNNGDKRQQQTNKKCKWKQTSW